MEQITLYYRSGASDKVYQASIQPADGGFIVPFAFGRRGTTLQTGTKTHAPVSYEEAKKIFDRLIAEKQAKGYTPGADGTPYQNTQREAQTTGFLPQLLNPIDEDFVRKLIANPLWWMQEKYDGRRLMLQKRGPTVTGINRRSLQVALPETLVTDALASGADFLLDGEAVGDQLFVFDLLRIDAADLRPKPYLERHLRLLHLLANWERRHIQLVQTACVDTEKGRLYEELKASGREGVVFKQIDQPHTAGRPASGGPALKFKFEEPTMPKRSNGVGAYCTNASARVSIVCTKSCGSFVRLKSVRPNEVFSVFR
ncbi:MAG TPA: WGR domain-containing protein [Chthoniobacteraceae bacterium]|nr:WGR domain-containing protein [Chthoniobacteraceae bacterium]